MELIREAINKAKSSSDAQRNASPLTPAALRSRPMPVETWPLPRVVLDATHLERQRIVSYAMTDPSHVAFNLLRTKVVKRMKGCGWKSLAIVSPTAGCGKTTVSINLALSIARAGCRTVLLDLDLKKSAIAKTLGIEASASIGHFLEGKSEPQQCFVQIGENLIVGLNNRPVRFSSELLQDNKVEELLQGVMNAVRPDFVLFDLPPMLVSDDAIAFLPRADCSLLVAGAGTTTAAEIDECERQATAAGNFMGVILNKCELSRNEYYRYDRY